MSRLSRRSFLGVTLAGLAAAGTAAAEDKEQPPAAPPAPEPPADGARPAGASGADAVEVRFTLNGEPRTRRVGADETALHTIRRGCGLTGTKEGCGAGTCGACTVIVDGTPHVTCLLPAVALEGRQVTTVEGLGAPEPAAMHPVQRAFLAHDALQCGYCTPGFVVEAVAFHDRWRAEKGTATPSRDEIAAALAGHLCRCGAYEGIFAAVAAACSGRHDAPELAFERLDGPEKVTGRATYTVDVVLEGMLEGRVLRSPHAHARLVSLDLGPAERIEGVKAVIRLVRDGGLARYVGQEIAAVAAVDRETADRAVRAIVAEWEVLPATLSLDEATKPGAPVVYPERKDRKDLPSAAEGFVVPSGWDGNLRGPVSSSIFGRPRAGRVGVANARANGQVGSGTFRTAVQCHTALEPHAAVARWNGADRVELWASTQSVADLAEDVAQRYKLPHDHVVAHAPYVGGGFGAKYGLQIEQLVALELARAAGAPVRVANDRAEELLVGGTRPGQVIEMAVGRSVNGSLMGITHRAYGEAGVAIGNATGFLTRIVYDTPNKDIDDYDVATHGPPGRPMRGPGGPPCFFALESCVDKVAQAANEDPIAVRRAWDPNVPRNHLYDWAAELPVWKLRGPVAADKGRYRRGVGLAAGGWFEFFDPGTQVELEASAEGLVARCGTQDVGSGTRTLLATTIAQALGLRPRDVRVELGRSGLPHGPSATGSRSTASIVPAAEHAAEQLKEALDDLRAARGLPAAAPLSEVLAGAAPIRVIGRRRRDDRAAMIPFAVADTKVGRVFPAVVDVMQVEVDTRLGRVRVLEGFVGIGVGRIVCPPVARSQILGAFVQNVGYALYEERRLDPATGRLLTHNLDDYRIAGPGDVPPCTVHFEERGFEHVRGGAVGLGEIGGVAVAAAIANAFHHATGVRADRLPLTPERVLGWLA